MACMHTCVTNALARSPCNCTLDSHDRPWLAHTRMIPTQWQTKEHAALQEVHNLFLEQQGSVSVNYPPAVHSLSTAGVVEVPA